LDLLFPNHNVIGRFGLFLDGSLYEDESTVDSSLSTEPSSLSSSSSSLRELNHALSCGLSWR
jgi:hypothetical protein